MVKITDITKNNEFIIVIWNDGVGEHATYFEPSSTQQEVRVKLSQLSEGFEISSSILNLIGDEF